MGVGGIWELCAPSAQYLCLKVISNSSATCCKLKVSSKIPPLARVLFFSFLIFINNLIIYLRSKINFPLLPSLCHKSISHNILLNSILHVSFKSTFLFPFSWHSTKRILHASPLSCNLPSTLPPERPSKKQSQYAPLCIIASGTLRCSQNRSQDRTMTPPNTLFQSHGA